MGLFDRWRRPTEPEAVKVNVLIYGNDKTIHSTTHLDIGVNEDGRVVEVWFRCMLLPFKQHLRDGAVPSEDRGVKLTAVQIEYPEPE